MQRRGLARFSEATLGMRAPVEIVVAEDGRWCERCWPLGRSVDAGWVRDGQAICEDCRLELADYDAKVLADYDAQREESTTPLKPTAGLNGPPAALLPTAGRNGAPDVPPADAPRRALQAPTPRVLLQLGAAADGGMVRFPWALLALVGMLHAERKVVVNKHGSFEVKATWRAQLDKSRLLRMVSPMIFLGAIPRDGIDREQVFRHTHAELGAAMGYTWPESYTRNAGRSPRMVKRTMRSLVKGAVYRFAFDAQKPNPKYGPDDYTMPGAKQMRADPEWKEYWRGVRGEYSGYAQMPAWICDPSTPGTPYEKLVLIALASFGLFKVDEDGRCPGEIQEELQTIGARVGVGKDCVRSALATYQGLGLLQVRQYPAHYEVRGKRARGGWELAGEPVEKGTPGAEWIQPPEGAVLRQAPNSIYYLPGREFDEEKASAEVDRFMAAAKRKNLHELAWFDVAMETHAATVREWLGTRQLPQTLHAESRRRMEQRSVPAWMIADLIPKPPP